MFIEKSLCKCNENFQRGLLKIGQRVYNKIDRIG